MSDCLAHRGPDDRGVWADPDAGIALGFRRLSIIDVSDAGRQPMQSASGRFTLVFNGEVYNFVELRAELETLGARFRGHSDTEVILAAFERWGIQPSVERFLGMFAMAVWDARTRSLSLIRDALGKKPLYVFHRPGLLTFGSELKALAAGPELDRTIDERALAAFLRYMYVPAPLTIFRHVRKLIPGMILTVRDIDQGLPDAVAYWSLDAAYARARANPFEGSDHDVVSELRGILSDAVRLRMRSDVPMGALLSGGIDSSAIVALMQSHSSRSARTFSISFPGTQHDEAEHAARIAGVLGTDHTELAVTGEDALAVVPKLPDIFDEPFADPSQIPTYLVCQLARRDVTVALTGDGGDEVFAGYERYIQGERLIGRVQRVPPLLRRVAGAGIRSTGAGFWDRAFRGIAPIVDRAGRHRLAGQKMSKLGLMMHEDTENGMYRSLLSTGWHNPNDGLASPVATATRVEEELADHAGIPLLDRMMLVDQATYLADDLLAKVDRASMAVSLEARVPLLDRRVVEFSWRLRRHHKVRDGRGKWGLRQVLYGFVDPRLVDRPKAGFTVPIADWLRGPLRSWAQALLFSTNGGTSMLSKDGVRGAWTQFLGGRDERALSIWTALMFEAWRSRWLP